MNQSDVKQLETYLRDELAAVETYQQCEGVIDDERTRARLDEVKSSHSLRANALTEKLRAEGGTIATKPSAWKPFAELVSQGAAKIGDGAALDVLARGERKGRERYLDDLGDLSEDARFFVEQHLLAEQTKTATIVDELESKAN